MSGNALGGIIRQAMALNQSVQVPQWPRQSVPYEAVTNIHHEVFDLTHEELRAAWLTRYGNGWVSTVEMTTTEDRPYFEYVYTRLKAFSDLETYTVLDEKTHTYSQVTRIKR